MVSLQLVSGFLFGNPLVLLLQSPMLCGQCSSLPWTFCLKLFSDVAVGMGPQLLDKALPRLALRSLAASPDQQLYMLQVPHSSSSGLAHTFLSSMVPSPCLMPLNLLGHSLDAIFSKKPFLTSHLG